MLAVIIKILIDSYSGMFGLEPGPQIILCLVGDVSKVIISYSYLINI